MANTGRKWVKLRCLVNCLEDETLFHSVTGCHFLAWQGAEVGYHSMPPACGAQPEILLSPCQQLQGPELDELLCGERLLPRAPPAIIRILQRDLFLGNASTKMMIQPGPHLPRASHQIQDYFRLNNLFLQTPPQSKQGKEIKGFSFWKALRPPSILGEEGEGTFFSCTWWKEEGGTRTDNPSLICCHINVSGVN